MTLSPSTERHVVGLIGADIGPSLSPALHEAEARKLGLRYSYERIDISRFGLAPERVGELLALARKLGFRGVNVTHPCKRLVVDHVDELSPNAAALGAVNTVVFDQKRSAGYNTDWPGFQESFARGLPDVALGDVVLLGAGGAGAAVAHAALSLGVARLRVADVNPRRADALVKRLWLRFGRERATVCSDPASALGRSDGLIHATPTGMSAHPGMPLPAQALRPELWVADVVYMPLETELLRHARSLGCKTLDGGGMAVFQAARSFELFTGIEPDRERMLMHFKLLKRDAPRELRSKEVA
jgi:shikimate dehydrogenase